MGLEMRLLQITASSCNTLIITRNEGRWAVRVRLSALPIPLIYAELQA
jgi:hypothetical protein